MSTERYPLHSTVFLIFVLTIFISSPSRAADSEQGPAQGIGKNLVGFKLGGYIPQSSQLEAFDLGGHGEVSVERTLSQYSGVGAAFGLFQANNTMNVPVSQGGTSTFASVDQTVRSAYLILNARLTVPAGAIEPYVEGGGGFYLTNIHESSSLGSRSKDDTSFGYHAGAGLNWFFTKEYYIGLGGRYFWAETDDQNIRLDGVLADVNLGFRF